MIDNYDFISSNGSGEKVPYVNGVKQLLNMLSAQEINLLRNKINEIIANANANGVPLYNKYTLAFKGDTNISLDKLQAGDVVARYYDGAINYYSYNGGNVNDDASYTLIGGLSSTQIGKFVQTYVSGAQDFTLPDFAQIISVFVRGHRTENYTVSGNVITINNLIGSGSEVVILYLEDLATGIIPYYTQAQIDNLHNVPVFNDGTTFVQRFDALKSNRTAQEFIYNTIDSPIPSLGLYAVTLTKWVGAGTFGTIMAVNTEPNTGQVYTKQIYNDVWGDWVEVGAGGGAESGEWTPTISALSNLTSVTNGNAYWYKMGNMVTLNYSASMVLAASGLLSFEITVPSAYPIVFENNNVGNGVLQNNGFTAVLVQSLAGGTKVSIQSKATIGTIYNASLSINLTYKTT